MEKGAERRWRWRAWLLAGLGAAGALLLHLLLGNHTRPSAGTASLAAFLMVTLILFGFTVEAWRWRWSLIFALAGGAVVGLVMLWNGAPDEGWSNGMGLWRLVSALIAVAVAVPFFQDARDRLAGGPHRGWRFDYSALYRQGWSAVMIWCAAWAFVGATFLTFWLLSELFQLIGIRLLRDALRVDALAMMLAGAAFGGAVGVLRDRDRLVEAISKIVRAVLGVLAPVLGAGLLLFLLSLPFTGLEPLWQATRSTTPILLSCIIGGLILVNAVIDDGAEDGTASPPLRFGAMAIAVSLLPLAVIAAISTGLRLDQYGLTPDRLWAVTFVAVACAYGLAYLVAVARGRGGWAAQLREANILLGLGTIGITLLLATPLTAFGALSAQDQERRLLSGQVTPERFDWPAMAFDFGPAGRRALERLARAENGDVAREARRALAARERWSYAESRRGLDRQDDVARHLKILPGPVSVPSELLRLLARDFSCGGKGKGDRCVLRYEAGSARAELAHIPGCEGCWPTIARLERTANGEWRNALASPGRPLPRDAAARKAVAKTLRAAALRGDFQARKVDRWQYFIGGEPVGDVFDPPPP